jgi:aryl-phospho-beta-D-glucosidase BglC (GH1 family)
MNNKIVFLPWIIKRGLLFLFVIYGGLISTTASAQLTTAKEIAGKMRVGWNLGNTLEATWAPAGTASQRFIDSVKAAGFNSVRLPCAWYNHSNKTTNVIDPTYLALVKMNIDYCINDSMCVMINIHWDEGWLENHITVADSAKVNAKQKAFWTQIVEYFKDYDEYLLFACANEPNIRRIWSLETFKTC